MTNDPTSFSAKYKEKVKSKLKFYIENPVQAASDLLDIDLPPVQRHIIRRTFDVNYCVTTATRGIGKTFLAATRSLLAAILIPNVRILQTGPTFRSGKFIFSEMERILNRSKKAQLWLKKPPVHQSDIWKCDFITGATLATMPLAAESESSIRGFRAHRLEIDEAPHVPQETFDLVLTPMLATVKDPMHNVRRLEKQMQLLKEGRIRKEDIMMGNANKMFLSTSAYFKFNHVYAKMQEFEKMKREQIQAGLSPETATFYFSYLDAPQGFIDMKAVEAAKRTMADFQFRMEWLAEWQNDSNGFYSSRLLNSLIGESPYYPEIKGERGPMYFMGIDPARTVDNFSISIAKHDEKKFKLVRVITFKGKSFTDEILKSFRDLVRDFPNLQAIYMDEGGGGMAFKDLVASSTHCHSLDECILDPEDPNHAGRRGKKILKVIRFNPQFSQDYNYAFKADMEHRLVSFPGAAPEGSVYIPVTNTESDMKDLAMFEVYKLIREMQSIQVTATGTGKLRFDGLKKTSETDRFTSTLLCYAAWRDVVKQMEYEVDPLPGGAWVESVAGGENEGGDWNG